MAQLRRVISFTCRELCFAAPQGCLQLPGKYMLAHAASAQGISAVENICQRPHVLNHNSVPAACFTHPEVHQDFKTPEAACSLTADSHHAIWCQARHRVFSCLARIQSISCLRQMHDCILEHLLTAFWGAKPILLRCNLSNDRIAGQLRWPDGGSCKGSCSSRRVQRQDQGRQDLLQGQLQG